MAVVLEQEGGDLFLRYLHGNSYRDPRLDEMVGKEVVCRGSVVENILYIDEWEEVGEG